MILAWIHFAPGGHADLIRAPVVTDDAASGMHSVTGTVDWNSGVEAGGVEPIVIVRRARAVPSPVMVLQGRVIPLHAGIHVAYRDAVSGDAKVVPDRVGADDRDVPFHVHRRPRGSDRLEIDFHVQVRADRLDVRTPGEGRDRLRV